MNLDDYLPPNPVQPVNRFWYPIRVFGHVVTPLLPFSEEPLDATLKLPPAGASDAITDDEIEEWDFSQFNLGLLCGEISGVTVLEVTTHSAQLWLDQQDLPSTPQWLSRRARYYLFHFVPELPIPVTQVRPGLRLLNGGAVVYPGSIYSDGRLVYWENSPDWTEVADLPDWLIPARNVVALPV